MRLYFSADTTIGELQSAFSTAFPGLKLVFFSQPHRTFKGSAAKFILQDKDLRLAQLSPTMTTGDLLVNPETTVAQLEQILEENYGLHVQVFRKSGRVWLETSLTDSLTLKEQMAKSANAEHVQEEFISPLDYREQD